MHRLISSVLVIAIGLLSPYVFAADPVVKKSIRKDFGLEKRVPWTTSRIHGTPEPPDPYVTENAFPSLKFYEPLAMAAVPGTNRLAVAERPGKIYTFENNAQTDKKELLLDVGRTIYGFTFHPKFAENGFIYVSNIVAPDKPDGSRVSRYLASKSDPSRIDPKTEKVILEWPSGGHNGGCLRFGPDGFLYLSTGDGSGIADQLQTGQDVSDLLGSILRLDVDHPGENAPYSIPKDNPFVGTEGARPEIYSYGHRQVWQFSFDRTGRLWAGEVGQDLWEMVYLIEKGGNYGWSVQEGAYPFRPERKLGPTPIKKPLVEHAHSDFRSITGGFVYYGSRLTELQDCYIYGDYDTGRIWALHYDGKQVSNQRELADTQLRLVAWGQDPAGEVYLVDFIGGAIHRLAKAPPAEKQADFPKKLSETGLFFSTKDNVPTAGLIPYTVNAELWSDGAKKERFIALPGESKIEYNAVVYPQPAPGAQPGWRFPDGTVLVKTFSLEMEAGNPASARRLETRILHAKRMPGTDEVGDDYWRGYTYIWNDEQTDAELLDARGLDRRYNIADKSAPGGKREQVYRFPSRAECTLCHTMSAKYALGVNTLQMNKDHDYGGVVANQIATLAHIGVFTKPLPEEPSKAPRIVDYRDKTQDLNERARSYLHSNCAHCHRKWGGGNAEFQLLASLPLTETGTIDVKPGHGAFDLAEPRVLAPGSPERSMVLYRMTKLGLGRMPHIASNVVDKEAVELVREWIKKMPVEGE